MLGRGSRGREHASQAVGARRKWYGLSVSGTEMTGSPQFSCGGDSNGIRSARLFSKVQTAVTVVHTVARP